MESEEEQLLRLIAEADLNGITFSKKQKILQNILNNPYEFESIVLALDEGGKKRKQELIKLIRNSWFYQISKLKLLQDVRRALNQNYGNEQLEPLVEQLFKNFKDNVRIVQSQTTLTPQDKTILIEFFKKKTLLISSSEKIPEHRNSIALHLQSAILEELKLGLKQAGLSQYLASSIIDEVATDPENFWKNITENQEISNLQKKSLYESLINKSQFQQIQKKRRQQYLQNFKIILRGWNLKRSRVFHLPIQNIQQLEWETSTIMTQIKQAEKKLIDQNFENATSLVEFIIPTFEYLYDCLRRNVCIKTVGVHIKECFRSKQLENKLSVRGEISQISQSLTINDVVFLILNCVDFPVAMSQNLTAINFPIQIYSENSKDCCESQNLSKILIQEKLRNGECDRIVVNLGSQRCTQRGKSTLLRRIFFLNDLTMNHKNSQFHNGAIDLYVNTCLNKGRSSGTLVIDIHGSLEDRSINFISVLSWILTLPTILLMHIQESEHMQIPLSIRKFFINANCSKVIFLIRDSRDRQEIRTVQIPIQKYIKFGNISTIRVPNNMQIQADELEEKLVQIRNKITHQLQNKELDFKDYVPVTDSPYSNIKDIRLKLQKYGSKFQREVFPNLSQVVKVKELEFQRQRNINKINGTLFSTGQSCINSAQDFTYIELIKDIENYIKELNIKPVYEISPILNEILKEMSKDFDFLRLLQREILQWRKMHEKPLEDEYLRLNNQLELLQRKNRSSQNSGQNTVDLSSQLSNLQQRTNQAYYQREAYDIEVDTFFNQLVAYDEKLNSNTFEKVVTDRYRYCYQNYHSINLIQGKTLKLGNKYLQAFFKDMTSLFCQNESKTTKKQTYIVSTIGIQSSAKSTLLNYLFGCDFKTSSGRCTKGVYYSICQLNNKVIVVLDTEGLLSQSGRNHAFNIQIASLIMKVSDLVIINNKGQLNTALRDLLSICMWVLLFLYKQEKCKRPIKLIFVIRDHQDKATHKQQSILSGIMKMLKESSSNDYIDYRQYFDLTASDIFPFQGAFSHNMMAGEYDIMTKNAVFGKSILALRSKIDSYLKEPKHKDLIEFYHHINIVWKILLSYRTDILNYKTLAEKKTKEQIQIIYVKLEEEYEDHKQFDSLRNLIREDIKTQQDQHHAKYIIKVNLQNLRDKFVNQFEKRCSNISEQMAWITDIIHSKNFFNRKKNNLYTLLQRKLQELRNHKQKHQFQDKVIKIADAIGRRQPNENAIKQFQVKSHQLLAQMKFQTDQDIQKQFGGLFVQNFKTEMLERWKSICPNKLNLSYLELWGQLNQAQSKQLFVRFIYSLKPYHLEAEEGRGLSQEDSNKLFKWWNQAQEQCKSRIQQGLKQKNLLEVDSVLRNVRYFYILIKGVIEEMTLKIKQIQCIQILLSHYAYITSISLKYKVEYYLFLYSTQVVYKLLKHRKEDASLAIMTKAKQFVNIKHQQLRNALQSRENIQQTALEWCRLFKQKLSKDHQLRIINTFQVQFDKLKDQFSNGKIIRKAFDKSFKEPQSGKEKWINCYKMVTNTNRFLTQILYRSDPINRLSHNLQSLIDLTQQNIQRDYYKILNKLEHTVEKSQVQVLTLRECEQLLSSIDLQLFSDRSQRQMYHISKKVLEQLRVDDNSIIKSAVKSMNYDHAQQILKRELKQLETVVLGCQSICPVCRAKCCKELGHEAGHEVLKNSHTLRCFGGIYTHQNNQAKKQCCFTAAMKQTPIWNKKNIRFNNYIEFIQKDKPRWAQHFKNGNLQDTFDEVSYKFIWAHIKDMFIQYFCSEMKDSNQYRNLKQPLNKQDMNLIRGDPTDKRKQILTILNIGQSPTQIFPGYKLKDF